MVHHSTIKTWFPSAYAFSTNARAQRGPKPLHADLDPPASHRTAISEQKPGRQPRGQASRRPQKTRTVPIHLACLDDGRVAMRGYPGEKRCATARSERGLFVVRSRTRGVCSSVLGLGWWLRRCAVRGFAPFRHPAAWSPVGHVVRGRRLVWEENRPRKRLGSPCASLGKRPPAAMWAPQPTTASRGHYP